MSNTPEALAAIIAEMREFTNVPYEGLDRAECRLLDKIDDYADSIEAAAERERAEFRRQLRNEIQINDALATVRPQFHFVDDVMAEAAKERAHEIELAKLRATGNSAATRKALNKAECVLLVAARFTTDNAFTDAEARENLRDVDWDGALAEIDAALSAPPERSPATRILRSALLIILDDARKPCKMDRDAVAKLCMDALNAAEGGAKC